MPVQLNDVEVSALVQILDEVRISAFNTQTKKSVLAKLMGNQAVIDTSKCIGGGIGAVFILENVAPGEVVSSIKMLRAATGWGLKEAKDAYDAADPDKKGGTLGPFRSNVPTFGDLMNNISQYEMRHCRVSGSIRLVAV